MAGVTLSPSHEPPRKRKGTGHTDQTVEKLKEGGYGGGGGGGGQETTVQKSWRLMLQKTSCYPKHTPHVQS